MLLRRVIEHVKTQNWTAIGLDFVIVVVGVFVGIQVSNWNDARREHAAERATLIRMQHESEQIVAFWNEQVRQWRAQNINRKAFLEALSAGAIKPEMRDAVDDAIMRLAHYPHFNPPSSVYDELVGAGGLGRISDLEARNAISEYASQLDFVNGQLTQFRTNLPELYSAYQGRIISTYDPERSSLRQYEYDIALLAADRLFVSEIVDAVRNQLQFQTYRELTLRDAFAMCEAVSRAAAMDCNPQLIDEEEATARDGVNQ